MVYGVFIGIFAILSIVFSVVLLKVKISQQELKENQIELLKEKQNLVTRNDFLEKTRLDIARENEKQKFYLKYLSELDQKLESLLTRQEALNFLLNERLEKDKKERFSDLLEKEIYKLKAELEQQILDFKKSIYKEIQRQINSKTWISPSREIILHPDFPLVLEETLKNTKEIKKHSEPDEYDLMLEAKERAILDDFEDEFDLFEDYEELEDLDQEQEVSPPPPEPQITPTLELSKPLPQPNPPTQQIPEPTITQTPQVKPQETTTFNIPEPKKPDLQITNLSKPTPPKTLEEYEKLKTLQDIVPKTINEFVLWKTQLYLNENTNPNEYKYNHYMNSIRSIQKSEFFENQDPRKEQWLEEDMQLFLEETIDNFPGMIYEKLPLNETSSVFLFSWKKDNLKHFLFVSADECFKDKLYNIKLSKSLKEINSWRKRNFETPTLGFLVVGYTLNKPRFFIPYQDLILIHYSIFRNTFKTLINELNEIFFRNKNWQEELREIKEHLEEKTILLNDLLIYLQKNEKDIVFKFNKYSELFRLKKHTGDEEFSSFPLENTNENWQNYFLNTIKETQGLDYLAFENKFFDYIIKHKFKNRVFIKLGAHYISPIATQKYVETTRNQAVDRKNEYFIKDDNDVLILVIEKPRLFGNKAFIFFEKEKTILTSGFIFSYLIKFITTN